MKPAYATAPISTYRLIPSQFPPIGLFDTVATASDLELVMELAGWTNDRLVAERVARLPKAEWVYGRPNASVVMAAFLHVAPGGMRFNGGDLGAWYAAASLPAAVAEVGHHLRREAVATAVATLKRRYRSYTANLAGSYLDIRGQQAALPEIYDSRSYAASQVFGEQVRSSGGDGVIFDSVRHAGGMNVVAYRPTKVVDVLQASHYEVEVRADAPRIVVTGVSA